jgi:mono/diheme cytochrome c family protein
MKRLILITLTGMLVLAACTSTPTPAPVPTTALAQPTTAPVQATEVPTAAPAPTETIVPPTEAAAAPTASSSLTADQVASAQQILNTACAACHSPDRVKNASGDLSAWQSLVQQMRDGGAQLTDDQAALVSQYLAQTYP